MPHYSGTGYGTPAALATELINKLRAAGLAPKAVNLGTVADAAGSMTATRATFEYAPDPLAGTQPWRVQVDGTTSALFLRTGTVAQLPDSGATNASTLVLCDTGTGVTAIGASNLYSYLLTVTPRGLICALYGSGAPSVGVAQRPLSADSSTLLTGKAPVFQAWNPAASTSSLNHGVVREADITVPATISLVGAVNASTTITAQTTEAGEYVLERLPIRRTARYVYREEMDLLMFMQADAIATNGVATVTLYGESTPRTYTATNAYTSGAVRAMVLTSGGGV